MKEKIASILTEILESDITPDQIHENTNLTVDLGMTSLNLMYLILEIENVFGVEVDLEEVDLDTFFVYKEVATYIQNELEEE
jgi:acyl carrier protein